MKRLKKQGSIVDFLTTLFKRVAIPIVFFLLVSVIFFSCGERAPVNEQYLESKDYKKFKKSQQKEYTIRIKNRPSLKKFLTNYVKCDLGKELDFAIHLDDRILEIDQHSCDSIGNKINRSFTTSYIGYSAWKDMVIRWILFKRKSFYDHAELLAVTYRNDSLIGFQTVGVFKDNLQQHFSTNIEVIEQDKYVFIHSVMERGLKYPFEYKKVIESTFQIDSTGKFTEQTAS